MRRKNIFLVCQHMENISRDALERYQDIVRDYVRRRHGIYALYRGNKLYYVGLATNLRSRLKQHLKDRHGGSWDRFSVYLTIGGDHVRELEALVLRIVKPKGNKQLGHLKRSENLKRRLARDLRSQYRKELALLIGRELAEVVVMSKSTNRSEDRFPVLAKYTDRALRLRCKFKGKTLTARVRNNGTIRFAGKVFNSPSLAAIAACGRRTCNGWRFWKYERAPGYWAVLDELRK